MTPSAKPLVNVAVAVLQRADGRVLLAERPRGKVSGGYWEFPGGKFEIAEVAEQALKREVLEEVGVEVDLVYPWMTYEHEYPDKCVRLHIFRALAWHGAPHGREGQRIAWEDPAALTVSPLLPANDKVLTALNLPAVYAITNADSVGVSEFMSRLTAALERGVQLIQVRERNMTSEQLVQFARRVVVQAHRHGARVLVNSDVAVAKRAGADGVHLQASQLMRQSAPPDIGFWSASCHDARELAHCAALHANFAVLSPVLATPAHPGMPGIGWAGFEAIIRHCPIPVYALGGMTLDLLDTAMQQGAHGVSLQRGIW